MGGVCVTVEEVGGGVAPDHAFRAGGVNRLPYAHLVVFQETTVPRTELSERASFLAGKGGLRIANGRRTRCDEVVFPKIVDGPRDSLCM